MVVELYDTERSYVEALQILVNVSIFIDSIEFERKSILHKKKKKNAVLQETKKKNKLISQTDISSVINF